MPNMPSWFGIVLIIVMVIGELLFCALPALLWALIGRQNLTEAFAWRRKRTVWSPVLGRPEEAVEA